LPLPLPFLLLPTTSYRYILFTFAFSLLPFALNSGEGIEEGAFFSINMSPLRGFAINCLRLSRQKSRHPRFNRGLPLKLTAYNLLLLKAFLFSFASASELASFINNCLLPPTAILFIYPFSFNLYLELSSAFAFAFFTPAYYLLPLSSSFILFPLTFILHLELSSASAFAFAFFTPAYYLLPLHTFPFILLPLTFILHLELSSASAFAFAFFTPAYYLLPLHTFSFIL
jgi:hypothetical protein